MKKGFLIPLLFIISAIIYNFIGGGTTSLINEITGNTPIPSMIQVSGGTFTMGDTLGNGYPAELPTHKVIVSSFSIGKYEVTNNEYCTFLNNYKVSPNGSLNGTELIDMDDSDCQITHNGTKFIINSGKENCPAAEITWHGAAVYCNYFSASNSLSKCYNESTWVCNFGLNGYRLPTEAEWEFAVKSGSNNKFSGSNTIDDVAWFLPNSGSLSHTVGTKKPNKLGLHDMSGNVWEWCNDWYGSYEKGSSKNPKGSTSKYHRVVRGGSWTDDAKACRVSDRVSRKPSDSYDTIGFRILLSQGL